ncbi:hypothetical protein [Bacillus infantis]|uniref:Uncharacterized protein n=1 Tax=Bacillus infantis TaxID=324767 RepID=A0A5D4QNU3_9BACI|nr:hypothetical protein [Bacillus infantis]TYS40765.1 hypothetical protein FZD51_24755 [Bacillus infantis]
MKKLLFPILVVLGFGVIIILTLTKDNDAPTLLEVSDNEVNNYLAGLESNDKLVTVLITEDKLMCYALLKNDNTGELLKITKTKDGYQSNKSSSWELTDEPISILEIKSTSHHPSILLAGIVTQPSIESVSLLEENNTEVKFPLKGNNGFIQPVDESVIKVEAFDKQKKKLWDSGHLNK